MLSLIKSETRKLFTIRSTYLLIALVLIMMLFFGFYVEGFKSAADATQDPARLNYEIFTALMNTMGFISILGLLLVTHEYRYNTINYTLTSSRSRTQTLLAKWLVMSIVAIIATLVIGILTPTLVWLGVRVQGLTLVPQTLEIGNLLWRCLFYGWAFASAGVLVAVLIRNQVGAIITFLFGIGVVESLMGLLLKDNVIYLPFNALNQVVRAGPAPSVKVGEHLPYLSPGKAALLFLAYLLIGWVVAWILFLRRDAN